MLMYCLPTTPTPATLRQFSVWTCGIYTLHVGGIAPEACGRAGSGVSQSTGRSLSTAAHQLPVNDVLEGSSELGVEDGVDDRVEKTVDVAEPDEEREQPRVHVAQRRRDVTSASGAGDRRRGHEKVVTQADRVDYVDSEEWRPAEQEHT